MKITIIAGARPNFMKIAPLMRAIEAAKTAGNDISARLVYTGSADDYSIEPSLFSDLDMPEPDVCLNITDDDFFKRMAGILVSFADELDRHPADVVMVVDDFTPTMACSIVAKRKGLKVAHLVAGTRSFDMNRPKEMNSLITDGMSDFLFTAGMDANRNLSHTGTEAENVYFVGNILIDTLRYNRLRWQKPVAFDILHLEPNAYVLLTLNRKAVLNDEAYLEGLFRTLTERQPLPVVAPLHNYVRKQIEQMQLSDPKIHFLPPQPYLAFGYFINHAKCIITDSGNLAEEATFLGIPCMTINDYAEHPETLTIGTNRLVGTDLAKLESALDDMEQGRWQEGHLPERWDGRAAERIVQILLSSAE